MTVEVAMKVLDHVRQTVRTELILCDSPQDVARVFDAAEQALQQSTAPREFKKRMFEDLRRSLHGLLSRPNHSSSNELEVKGQEIIDAILKRL